jgi:hypothetical protein
MNPTLPEEAGQTARSFLDIMKQQPALLGSILTNIALIVFIFYALQGAASYRERLTQQVLDNATAIHAILNQRSVACPDVPKFNLQSDESKPVPEPK